MSPLPSDLLAQLDSRDGGLTILALRFGAFGDIVRTLPATGLVRQRFPGCRILWGMDDRWSGFFEGRTDLDGIVVLPRREWGALGDSPLRWPSLAVRAHRWFAGLAGLGVDVVLDFHGNLRSGLAGWRSRAPIRLGYSGHQQKEGNRWFSTHRIPPGPRRVSRIDRNLALVAALGVDTAHLPDAGLRLEPEAVATARSLVEATLGRQRPYAVLSPGASRAQIYKRPPVRLLAPAVRRLHEEGLDTLVVWGPGEEQDARRVVETAPGATRMSPPTDLPTLAALIRGARLFVGGDTGPLHLACGVGCPVLGIYAPTDPVVNAPWGVPFRVVAPRRTRYTGIKKHDRLAGRFDDIDVDDLRVSAAELLGEISG